MFVTQSGRINRLQFGTQIIIGLILYIPRLLFIPEKSIVPWDFENNFNFAIATDCYNKLETNEN